MSYWQYCVDCVGSNSQYNVQVKQHRHTVFTLACFITSAFCSITRKHYKWHCIPFVLIAAWVDVPSDIAAASGVVVAIDTWRLSCRYVIADWSPRRQDATRLSLDSGQLLWSRSLHRYWRNPTGFTTATTSTRRCAVYTGSIRYIRHQSLSHSYCKNKWLHRQ